MADPAILFVKPGSIKPSDKGRLSRAGVTVVEIEDPSAVKLVRAGMEMAHGDILCAAARAISEQGNFDSARELFGKHLAAALIAAHEVKLP